MTDIVERLRTGDVSIRLRDGSIKYVSHVAADEIERLREAVKAFSCDCFEGQCAQWGEDGPRFDCVFRRYRGLVEGIDD